MGFVLNFYLKTSEQKKLYEVIPLKSDWLKEVSVTLETFFFIVIIILFYFFKNGTFLLTLCWVCTLNSIPDFKSKYDGAVSDKMSCQPLISFTDLSGIY